MFPPPRPQALVFGVNHGKLQHHASWDSNAHIMSALTIQLDPNTLGALDRLAEKTDRSREWLVNKAVEDYVAVNAWQIRKIEEGIAAADRGDFASDEELARLREKFAPA